MGFEFTKEKMAATSVPNKKELTCGDMNSGVVVSSQTIDDIFASNQKKLIQRCKKVQYLL